MIIKMSGVPNDLQKYNFLKILLKIKVKFTHLNKIKLPQKNRSATQGQKRDSSLMDLREIQKTSIFFRFSAFDNLSNFEVIQFSVLIRNLHLSSGEYKLC